MEIFAEMIFVHGFVHGDPHPGNILVSPQVHQDFSIGMTFILFMKLLTNLLCLFRCH